LAEGLDRLATRVTEGGSQKTDGPFNLDASTLKTLAGNPAKYQTAYLVDMAKAYPNLNSAFCGLGFASWGDVKIRAFEGLWTISMIYTGIEQKQWSCYQRVAQLLLDTPDSTISAQDLSASDSYS